MYRTDFWTLWEKARVGCSERIALKQAYYQGWSRSPAQVGCMREVLRAGALGRPRGMGWGGRREGGSGWGTHVNPWMIHVNVWQKPLQYCKVNSLRLIKINLKKEIIPGNMYSNVLLCDKISVLLGENINHELLLCFQTDGETSDRLYFGGLQNHCRWWLQP